jgi:hypothetical protein
MSGKGSLVLGLCATLMIGAASRAADGDEEPATDVEVYPVYDSNWVSYAALGAQFLPDYDEEGRSSGLSKQQFFASMTVDGRFNDDAAADGVISNPLNAPFHTGVTLSLLGTPIKREDRPSVSPTEFNDVAQTIVSSLYLYSPSLYRSKSAGHNIGPLVRVGAISRESLGESGDSVNWFYSIGIQYSSMKFLDSEPVEKTLKDGTKKKFNPLNGVPEGYIRLSAARFEDYAGLGRKTRLVADAALRIYPKLNMFLGVQGNFGEGPDEFMLVVSMVRQPHEIANLFSLGKEG